MKFEKKIVAFSVFCGVLTWVLDAGLDYFFFYKGTFLQLLVYDTPGHEIYIRFLILLVFLVFGLIVSRVTAQREEAREETAQSEENLRITLNSIGDAVISTDTQGCVVHMNPVALELTGWQMEQAVGKPLTDVFQIVNARTGVKAENPVGTVLEKGVIVGLANHTKLISKNGTEYQIADSASPIRDGNGRITGVVLVFRDVTEEYTIREALEQSEERLRAAASNLNGIVYALDRDLRFTLSKGGKLKMMGLEQDELIGKTLYEYFATQDSDHPEIASHLQALSGEDVKFETRHGGVTMLTYLSPMRNAEGEITGVAGLSLDITEQKNAEEALLQMEKLKSVGTLAGGIAHDFNNFLMAMFGNMSIAREDLPQGHPARDSIEEAEKSLNRATRLTKQLLTFARGGSPVLESVAIDRVVRESIEFDLSGSNVEPVFEQQEDLWHTEADKGQIQQVISNLTHNADQAMPEGGRLYVSMENVQAGENEFAGIKEGKYVKITMRDQGAGIDKKHLDRIFDPYFTTKQAGSGLGLATTHSIVTKHGGHISCESEPGRGTVFSILLPASKFKVPGKMKQTEIEPPSEGKRYRVLVMDDEEPIRSLVEKMLTRMEFEVETAADGSRAVEMYQRAQKEENPFDAVIMDLTIPGGMGGKEAVAKMLEIDPEARCVVSSGYASDPVMSDYRAYGFAAAAEKPYTKDQLREVLQQVFN